MNRNSRHDDRYRQEDDYRMGRTRERGGWRSGEGMESRGDYQGRNQGYMEEGGRGSRHSEDPFDRSDARLTAYDEDYATWRSDHLNKLDDDYQEWRSERRKQFQQEFDKWRNDRTSKTSAATGTGTSKSGT
jgi:hypothetical protein